MTKKQEIELLRQVAGQLGRESYCGPWLQSIIPEVEHDIQSDFPPMATWRGSRDDAAEIITNARAEAERIVRQAKDDAKKEIESSDRRNRQHTEYAIMHLKKALIEIGG